MFGIFDGLSPRSATALRGASTNLATFTTEASLKDVPGAAIPGDVLQQARPVLLVDKVVASRPGRHDLYSDVHIQPAAARPVYYLVGGRPAPRHRATRWHGVRGAREAGALDADVNAAVGLGGAVGDLDAGHDRAGQRVGFPSAGSVPAANNELPASRHPGQHRGRRPTGCSCRAAAAPLTRATWSTRRRSRSTWRTDRDLEARWG